MTHMRITLLSVVLIALRLGAEEANWPEFRGPQGNGISTATNLPLALGRAAECEMADPDP